MVRSTLIGVALLATACAPAPPTPEAQARALFERYVDLEKAGDEAIFDLYADGGRIEKYIITREGQRRDMGSVSLAAWKERSRPDLADAVARGVRNAYSDVTYQADGDFVRIRMRRLMKPPGVTLAQEFLVGPGSDGKWLIWEEISQAHSTRY